MSASQQKSPELDTLVKITEILTGPLQFAEKRDSILAVLAHFTGSDLVTLRELDPENFTLNLVASFNDLIPIEDSHVLVEASPNMPARALELRSPVVFNDYLAVETRHEGYVASGVRSALSLPIQVDGDILGILGFASKSLDHYQEDTVRVLVAIAAIVGMMMVKAELQDNHEVEAKIGRIVSAPLVGPDVFRRFAAESSRTIEFDRLALNSIDSEESTYITEFIFGDQVPDFPLGKPKPFEGSAIATVARRREGRRFLLDDRDGMKPKYPNAESFVIAGQRFLLCVPLIVGDQVIGALGFNRGSRQFSHKDMTKAGRLASLVAGAFYDFKLQEYMIRSEREINRNRSIYGTQAEIGRIVSSPMEISEMLRCLAAEITKLLSFDRLSITGVDLKKRIFDVEFLYTAGDRSYFLKSGDPIVGTVVGAAIESGESIMIDAADAEWQTPRFEKSRRLMKGGPNAFLAVPLVFRDQIAGGLALARRGNPYSVTDQELASRIGDLISGVVAGHVLRNNRTSAESDMKERETRFRQIENSIRGVFWLTELEPRRLVYASPNFEDLWGIPVETVYDDLDRWYEPIHPDDRDRIRRANELAPESGGFEAEYRIIKRDGSVRWVRSSHFPVKDENGKIYRMSGIGEDITDQKLETGRITNTGQLPSIRELACRVAQELNHPLASLAPEKLISVEDLERALLAATQKDPP